MKMIIEVEVGLLKKERYYYRDIFRAIYHGILNQQAGELSVVKGDTGKLRDHYGAEVATWRVE